MTFTEKVQSMTAKEIIMAMVEGLRKPYTEIRMCDWGTRYGDVCYGCAATNTICHLTGGTQHLFPEEGDRIIFDDLVDGFETAINYLRCGDTTGYNQAAIWGGFAQIRNNGEIALPELTNDYTEEQLLVYVKLAELQ